MEDNVETAVQEKTRVLVKSDRCDARNCPAQAFVLAKFITGELYFCGHHFSKHEDAIVSTAYDIVDEREMINSKSESSA